MDVPYSARFGDIYFSAEDGLAETRHVFLDGNGLPGRWRDRADFTILETGFGTGLNFLAAWSLHAETAPAGAVLDYVAVELYPLDAGSVRAALARWSDTFGARLGLLLDNWPMRVPGYHRIHLPGARLTLIHDDAARALSSLDAPRGVDSWFLDGFAPARNPDMWSDALYREMKRLSAPDATAATFTAAGAVRRGLAEAGFAVEKTKGFGRKRDMIRACLHGTPRRASSPPRRAGIAGGGLAGSACAWALARRGVETVVHEAADAPASAASGNPVGLCNPRFSSSRTPQSDFFTASFALAARTIPLFSAVPGARCGSLHLVTTPERDKRFASMLDAWGWHPDHMRMLDAAAAGGIAGVPLLHRALWLPDGLWTSPARLCVAYLEHAAVKTGCPVSAPPDDADFDAFILACGVETRRFADLPVHTVRGQTTRLRATAESRCLRTNLCYGGYLSPAGADGLHTAGSTFQKWLDSDALRPEDDAGNIARLAGAVPALAGAREIVSSRAGLRVASRDHFPIAGALDGRPGLFVSAAHGSHGLVSTLACAEYIADLICETPRSLSRETVLALSPGRFAGAARACRAP